MALPLSVPRARQATQRRRKKFRLTDLLLNLLLAALIALLLLPIFFLFVSSLKTGREFLNSSSFFPRVWQWGNYAEMWRIANFGEYFRNSFIICGVAAAVGTFFAALSGYALTRFRFPGSDLFSLSITGTQLIPGTLFFIPLYLSFLWIRNNLGIPLIGTNFGGILLYTGFYIPISLWVMRSFFAAIPVDLEEQAMVDGATRFQAFTKIVLPLTGPGLVSTAIFIFLTAWDELFFASILRLRTVPMGLLLFAGNQNNQARYDLVSAGAVAVTIPIILIFLLLQRRLVEGLTAGAVK
jgi:multiple sugar transport system permease protein